MEEDNKPFFASNISCISLDLHWLPIKKENQDPESYEIFMKKTGIFSSYNSIYKGNETKFKVVDLKPETKYNFKLKINYKTKKSEEFELSEEIKTLIAPVAILSDKSVYLANNNINRSNNINQLNDVKKHLIKSCAKLNFSNNDINDNNNFIIGNFDGIIIKIAYESNNKLYYISFDINPDYYDIFIKEFIKEKENNVLIPCYFIIQKLPTILFFHLLETNPIIFTGLRMGGIIAASLAFYILYLGKSLNKNYGNALDKFNKNNIGVITFGSPAFLTNLAAGLEMNEVTNYFYHIKYKLDFIPMIFDLIKEKFYYEDLVNIIMKKYLIINDMNKLKTFWEKIKFSRNDLKENFKIIPFGNYIEDELLFVNEIDFKEFYYLKIFNDNNFKYSHLKIYENLLNKNEIYNYDIIPLTYLKDKNLELNYIKIIRRKVEIKSNNENEEIVKGIIKFKLTKFDNKLISPDIIKQIRLYPSNNNNDNNIINNEDDNYYYYLIKSKDIFYDNDEDISAYIDNLKDDINKVIIDTYFNGQIKVEHITNIQGSGSTRKMLKDNIEKIFIIPFFKLFEILYISLNDENKFKELKKENFGKDFTNIKILKPFENQIINLNELLFFTRPDLLGKHEKEFKEEYTKDIIGGINEEKQKEIFEKNFKNYYNQAKILQNLLNINCENSQINSIAKNNSFPEYNNNNKKSKLFMCNCSYSQLEKFIIENFDDSFIKYFFVDKLIIEILKQVEEEVLNEFKNKNNEEECKNYLNSKIDYFYKSYIIPNVYFILILILSSIESGDYMKFDKTDWKFFTIYSKIFFDKFIIPSAVMNIFPIFYILWFKKDFGKVYTKDKIEKMSIKNLFYKNNIKNIIKSNINTNVFIKENPLQKFSEYSEKCKIGKEYYEKFLDLLKIYSNDFFEDIEISIFDNLKEQNKDRMNNLSNIEDLMNYTLKNEDYKKGFLALLKQSYLLGKFRTNIVRIKFFKIYFIIGRRIYNRCIWKKKGRKIYFYRKNISRL